MIRSSFRPIWALTVLAVCAVPALAQQQEDNYRQFFKPPETAPEFWGAMKFEIRQGKFEIAAEFLKGFVDKVPTDQQLLDIEEKEGLSSFLRLRTISKWSDDPKITEEARKNTETVIDLVAAAQKKLLSDPARIDKFVANLSATPAERTYAIRELRRSGSYGIPAIINKLKDSVGTPDFAALVAALPYLTQETVPAQLAALDIPDPTVRAGLIDALAQGEDLGLLPNQATTNPLPILGYLAAAPDSTDLVKKKAAELVGRLLTTDPSRLPSARAELTRAADKYYEHRIKFVDPKAVEVWRWDGKELKLDKLPATQAEQYYGLRFTKLALNLDAASEAAQVLLLSFAIDKGVERGSLEQPLGMAPEVKELISTLNADVVVQTLEKALTDRRTNVVLGTVRALGDLAEVKAVKTRSKSPPALVRALNYPDRRVQLRSAVAILSLPTPPPPQSSGRIVDILRRALAADGVQKVIVADANRDRAEEVATAVKAAGYEPVVVTSGKLLLERLAEAADIDALLIDYKLFDPDLRSLVAKLRSDADLAQIPLFLTIPPLPDGTRPPAALGLNRLAEPYRNIEVVNATNDPEILGPMLKARIAAAFGQPLLEEERKNAAIEAMGFLKRMAVGEITGYDVQPAASAIFNVLRTEVMGKPAAEATARLPGKAAQRELAKMVLDDALKPDLRAVGAVELSHHIQQNGLALLKQQREGLTTLFETTEDARLRGALAQVIGASRPDAERTGEQLKLFNPAAPAAPPPPAEKEKEKN